MKRNLFFFYLFILSFSLSCTNDNTNRSFKLSELEDNRKNSLRLRIEKQPDILRRNEKLSVMDRYSVENFLRQKDISFFDASFGIHFLGNRFFLEDNFEKGLYYQHLSADEYMNPYAMLKLAIIYSKDTNEILKSLPKGVKLNFKKDLEISFRYLHRAINTAILIMEKFNDRTAIDDINRFGQPLIELFEKRDSNTLGSFDVKAAEEKAALDIKNIKSDFNKIYETIRDESSS